MKLHVHTLTWVCGLVGCRPSSVAINFLDHVTKWAPHGEGVVDQAAVLVEDNQSVTPKGLS